MKKVRCPQCGKLISWEGNPYRPFCSERCQLIDLGRWLTGDYFIEVPPEGVEDIHDLEEQRESDTEGLLS